MKIGADGLDIIRACEGFRSLPYLCPAGYPTIGYGHLIPSLDHPPCTEAEAGAWLAADVGVAERAVGRLIRVSLSQGQFDALVSFTFNLGGGALQRSALRAKCNREEHADVPDEFLRWVYAGGRKLAGLIRRRGMEARLYARG